MISLLDDGRWIFVRVRVDDCIAMPWWDETLDAGNFAASDLFTDPNYFGHLPAPAPDGSGYCIQSGAFSGLTLHIGPGGSTTTPHCLARAVNEQLTGQCNTDFVNYCNSRTSYADMESCAEQG